MTPYLKRLDKTLQMGCHNICFMQNQQNYPNLSQNTSSYIQLCFLENLLSAVLFLERFENLINSLTTEKQTTKFSSANFKKMLSPSYIILRIQRLEDEQCRSR